MVDATSPGIRRSLRTGAVLPVVAALPVMAVLTSCYRPGLPEWAPQPSCSSGGNIYLPSGQSPERHESDSEAAADCILSAYKRSEPAELSFVLLGVGGEEYPALLQVLPSGLVNYAVSSGSDVSIHEECGVLEWPYPGIPDVAGCASGP